MKKALLVTRVSGFIPQHEMNNVKILQEMGYEVHYATNLQVVVYGKDNSRLEGTGIITHQIDFCRSPFSSDVKKSYRQLKELLRQEKFDLIHCHMPMSGVVCRLAAEKVRREDGRQVPVLYTAHGLHFYTGAPLKNWIYYPMERYLARYTDRLLLINQEDYKRGQTFPIRGKVEYVPGVGIRPEDYQSLVPDRMVIERLLGRTLSPETNLLLDVGELSRRKNHHLLVEMMAELRDMDLICIIGGTGAEKSALEALIHEKGLEQKVFLPGYIEDVKQFLSAGDCFVFPSYQEGLPVAVMEAMAAGLPVVASRIRGVTDLVEHGKGGYLVQGFDPVDYAVKIRGLFTEKGGENAVAGDVRRSQMGQWNRERIRQFSLEIVDRRMREIYQEILS